MRHRTLQTRPTLWSRTALVCDRGTAHRIVVVLRFLPEGCVDQQVVPPLMMKSTRLGRPSPTFITTSTGIPRARRYFAVPPVARMRKPRSWKRRTIGRNGRLVVVIHSDEDRTLRERMPAADISALANAIPNESSMPITSPVSASRGRGSGRHSEFVEGEDRFLHRHDGGAAAHR